MTAVLNLGLSGEIFAAIGILVAMLVLAVKWWVAKG
jgi:hypothetical protein